MAIIPIIAAILLPPLGIFLTRGLGRDFWICTLLTLLAFIPGMVFALYVVVNDRNRPSLSS